MSAKPLDPVQPLGMELVFFYPCPYCHAELPLVAPTRPSMITCERCRNKFPIAPIDAHSVQFVKTMLGDGPAAVDPEYL